MTDKALDMITDAFFVFDLEGRFMRWNKRLGEVTGYSDEEIAGMRPVDLFAGHDVQRVAEAICKVVELGEAKVEAQVATKDGRIIPYEFTGSLLYDSNEMPYAMAGTGRDISERKCAEEALRNSDNRFRDVVLSSAGFVWETDDMGRFTYCSERVKDVLGYEPEEMLGRTTMEFLAEDDVTRVVAVIRKIVTNGEPMRDIETRVVAKDGSEVILQTSGIPILGDNGAPLGYRGVGYDVTTRRNAEEKLTRELEVSAALVYLKSAMLSLATFEEISGRVLETAISLTGSVFGFTGYIDPKTGFLVSPTLTRNAWETCQIESKEAVVFDKFGGLWGWVLDNKRSVLVNEVAADPRSSGTPEGHLPITRFLSAPALIGDELVGQIAIANRDTDYTEEDLEVIERLAKVFALAIQRQHADEALRESEARLSKIMHSIPAGILLIDAETHEIVDANPAVLEMIGDTRERVVGSVCQRFVCPAERGACPISDLHQVVEHSERTLLTANGACIPILKTVVPLELEGRAYLVESLVDITERKKAEEETAKFKSMSDRANYGVALVDLEGNITYINDYFALVHGYQPTELLGKNLTVFHNEGQLEEVYRLLQELKESGSFSAEEVWHADKDGRPFPMSMTGTLIKDDSGTPLFMGTTATDISESKRAEKILKESEERYRTLYESSQDALMTMSPPSWKFTSCNPAALEMFGAKDERELTSVGPGEVSPDLQPDGRLSADKAGEMIEAAMRDGSSLFEWTHRRLDGEEFPATVLLTRMEISGETVVQATVRDITANKAAEESLRDSKEELQAIYDGIGDGVMVLDLEAGAILRANPALALMLGYSQEELAGMAIASIHPPDELARVDKEMEKGREGKNLSQELTCLRKDGSVFLADMTGMNINYQGRPCGVAIFKDITERKAAEEMLWKSEKKYRQLYDNAGEAIFSYDPELILTDINRIGCKAIGYSREEVLGKNVLELNIIHPRDLERAATYMSRHFAGEDILNTEYTFIRKDGSERLFSVVGAAIRDTGGNLQSITNMCRDITEERRVNKALLESEEKFREFAENLPEVVAEADSLGKFVYLNANGFEAFGYTEEELYSGSINILELLEEEDRERAAQKMQKILSEGPQGSNEYLARRKDGSVFPVIIATLPVIRDGATVGLRVVLTDVTAQKKTEEALVETNSRLKEATAQANELAVQAEAANRAKSEFLANMSHEIRTPMNGVIGMSELLLDSGLTTEQGEYAEALRRSGEDLLSIINDILDFSKIEARKMELSPAPFMLRENAGTSMKALAIRANEKGLELVVEILEEVPDRLVGDWGRLRQVLVNLVGNAIKFTEKGEIVLSIALESQLNGSVVLAFSVSDTGIGIPFDHQESIFASFTQVDSSTTRVYGGTGLGLTISAQLVELMGGAISVESDPGSGSTFTFDARLALDTEPPEPVARLEPPDLQGLRVLVVDDNATNRRVLEGMLGNWGMAPTSCPGGPEALKAMEAARKGAEEFVLVLLDLRMPVMDGFEFVERVRKGPACSGIAIILLTSAVHPEDSTRIAELKIARSITKPVTQSELLNAIIDALSEERNAEAEPEPEPEPVACYRILLAEDNEINRRVAGRMLERAGHTVVTATDGGEAVAAFARGHFDLVLMDMQMPVMDGVQATAAIRSAEKDTGRHVPIVALTAHAMKGDEERFLDAGMDGYLPKPITFESLYETIERLLGSGSVDALHEVAGEEPGKHIDEDRLLRQMGGDRDLAREVVQLYFKHYPGWLRDIARAVSAGDAEQLNMAAHALKGSVSNIAADRAFELAFSLERMGEEGDLEAAVEVLEDLGVELDAIAAFFREGGWADEPQPPAV